MATYTPNYGLHQWVPEDQFLRTDFNEDFKKIDTALGEKADQSSMSSSISSIQSSMNSQLSSIKARLTALEKRPEVVIGTYTGDGAETRFINLGFTPKAVLLEESSGMRVSSDGTRNGGLALQDSSVGALGGRIALQVVTGGFQVSYIAGYVATNRNNNIYRYLAFK